MSYGHLKVIEEVTALPCDEVVFTGGASKGVLWPRVMADVLGLPVKVPKVKESTALGAAILAGIGVGEYPDVATAAGVVADFETTLDPHPSVHERYEELYTRWNRIYDGELALVDQGLLKPLWKAAGT